MLGSFKNWNMVDFSHKAEYSENIDKINKVILYSISDNMAGLLKTVKYGAINKTDATKMVYYVIKSLS